MAGLSDIVDVTISTQDAVVSRSGFGVPLILGVNMTWTNRVRYYADLDSMAVDGMVASTPEYKAAAQMFGQIPAPTLIGVGRVTKPTLHWRLTPNTTLPQVIQKFSVTINGVQYDTANSDASPTQAEMVALLVTAMGGISGITPSNQTTYCDLAAAAGAWFAVESLDLTRLDIEINAADPGFGNDLNAIKQESNEWYGIVNPWASAAIAAAVNTWAGANEKLFVQASQDSLIPNTVLSGGTDVATTAKNAAWARTAIIYNQNNGSFADAAWMGRCLPLTPGSETWKFKTLSGVPASILTPTQQANLTAKKCNFVYSLSGINLTSEGWVSAGEFIDIIRGRDWLKARIQEDVFVTLQGADKVPFTDAGVALVEAPIRARLADAVSSGFLSSDPAPVVVVPKVANVSAADRGNRLLPNVLFYGTIAGAIHKLAIRGTLKV